jgi:hypothetical protein
MRTIQLTLFTLCLLLMSPMSFAQEKKEEPPMDPQAMMELYKKLAKPGEPHELFASLTGSWTTKTKEWMDPEKPPVESTGSAEMKMLLGGRFLQQEFTGDMMGKPYSGIGISGYDNILKRYVSIWIDTMSTDIFTMAGTASADGRTITLNGQHAEPGGGYMTHRAVWNIISNVRQTFIMYGKHHGGKEQKMLEIVYTR